MAIQANGSRFQSLHQWMQHPDRQITFTAVAGELDLSESMVRKHLRSETMPTEHHKKLVALGFPRDLLPRPEDKRPGRKRMTPKFPGKPAKQIPPINQPPNDGAAKAQ